MPVTLPIDNLSENLQFQAENHVLGHICFFHILTISSIFGKRCNEHDFT